MHYYDGTLTTGGCCDPKEVMEQITKLILKHLKKSTGFYCVTNVD
jgi:hypothetical protein